MRSHMQALTGQKPLQYSAQDSCEQANLVAPICFLGPFVGAPAAQLGVPGVRRRWPPEQYLVNIKIKSVVLAARRALAKRQALCAALWASS